MGIYVLANRIDIDNGDDVVRIKLKDGYFTNNRKADSALNSDDGNEYIALPLTKAVDKDAVDPEMDAECNKCTRAIRQSDFKDEGSGAFKSEPAVVGCQLMKPNHWAKYRSRRRRCYKLKNK